ncbi:hypothetical protein H7X46_22495 [Pseudonocardia sp. C8]|uniref:hypothetical protein n=1 Tax=Pseudonocardia sp. C8 TaxID=2762759 RepID=UPI00164241EE|nr:hypothetical protein [Pseudonocardia sp. C8]MBC3193835.1 hypothetical protein [Pseudonocardia sp. C8]
MSAGRHTGRRAWILARLPLGRLRVTACGLCAALVAAEHTDAHDRYHRAVVAALSGSDRPCEQQD